MSLPVAADSLERYMGEIGQFQLLSRDEEYALAVRYREHGDIEAAHTLVTRNLRFVVKIANEYRSMGLNFIDVIQEGNIGLMKAVKKFDPAKGYRLISYAVWWIRAQIHSFIIKSWSLVKIGTTQAQRKIFAKLRSTRKKLTTAEGVEPEAADIAKALNVNTNEVAEMEMRMAARDFSLDVTIDGDSATTHLDLLPGNIPSQEEIVAEAQEKEILQKGIRKAMKKLNEKERFILTNRVMAEEPMTLKEIGKRYSISRERVRQIEKRTLKKLKGMLKETDLVPA